MAITASDGRSADVGDRLRGWKEIARWVGVDERTVKRWEATRGMPVHRVPGEARAPVFAYRSELAGWLASRGASVPVAEGVAATAVAVRRPPARVAGLVVGAALLAIAALLGWQSAAIERERAQARTADVRHLAVGQVTTLGDRLENLSGTVELRAALAADAARVLERVATAPEAAPALRQAAADAYRRLARVQSATDRPSLRDRSAARASLDRALALVADDRTPAGRQIRARILIDAARHAAAGGAVGRAPAMLARAAAEATDMPPGLREELQLARSEIAQWQGNYPGAAAQARAVVHALPATPDGWMRQIRARDLVAEALYYAGDAAGAVATYREALALAVAGAARFRDRPTLRWAVLRQQWNLGSSLVTLGQPGEALPLLAASRDGWAALARADPGDVSLDFWLRTTQLAHGEALAGHGQTDAALAEIGTSLAGRRALLAAQPGASERQRWVVVALQTLGDVHGGVGHRAEACAQFTEAAAIIRAMAAADSLTGLDRDSVQAVNEAGLRRYCLAAPAVSA